MRTLMWLFLSLSIITSLSCDKSEESGKEPAAAESNQASAGALEEKSKARSPREKKDRGEARMIIGGVQWTAGSASARLRNGTLTISANKSDYTGGMATRQSLDLGIGDYKGPGSYTTKMGASRYVEVGIDTSAANAAGDSDEAVKKEAVKAIRGAEHVMITNAAVEIVSADDDEIVGTFSWTPPQGIAGPAITEGSFRAKVK